MDPKLLEILVCPITKGPLVYDKEKQELISKSARLAYPIRDDIPVMLEDEARRLEPSERVTAGERRRPEGRVAVERVRLTPRRVPPLWRHGGRE